MGISLPKLDVQGEIARLQQKYAATAKKPTYNFLIMGKNGVGKTQLARTAWLPVHIDSFDVGGTTHLIDEVKAGKILIDTTWEEMAGAGKVGDIYEKYVNTLRARRASGYFDRFGTYMLDSLTGFAETLVEAIIKQKVRSEGLIQSDYKVLWRMTRDILNEVANIPCDIIVTGHLQMEDDDVSGKREAVLLFPGKYKFAIGSTFNEIYILGARPVANGAPGATERVLLTRSNEKYTATTKLGHDGKFDAFEPPDIMALRRKAGQAVEHKPLLVPAIHG